MKIPPPFFVLDKAFERPSTTAGRQHETQTTSLPKMKRT